MRWLLTVLIVGCGSTAPPTKAAPAVNPGTPQVFEGSLKIENPRDEERCRSFKKISQDLVVEAPGLTHMNLRGVETIGDDLFIASNTALVELDLQDLKIIGGGLFLWDNAALVDTPGLRNVRAVGGALHVTNNGSLERLTLGAVSGVGALRITSNPKLTDLSGLANVELVQGDLTIENNAALAALPFGNLKEVRGNIRIADNPKLPMCRAEAMVERLRAAGYSGSAVIVNNDGVTACE